MNTILSPLKTKVLVLCLFASILSIQAQTSPKKIVGANMAKPSKSGNCNASVELLNNCTINFSADDYGSSISIKDTASITFSYSIAERLNDTNWTWIDVVYQTGDSSTFMGTQGIEITYKSDDPLLISLPFNNLLYSYGENHQVSIPASPGKYSTIELNINEFNIPVWADSSHLNYPLYIDSVSLVDVSIDVDTYGMTGGISGTYSISHIGLCNDFTPLDTTIVPDTTGYVDLLNADISWELNNDTSSIINGYYVDSSYYFEYYVGTQASSYASAILTVNENIGQNITADYFMTIDSIEINYRSFDYLAVIMPQAYFIDSTYGYYTFLEPAMNDTTVMIYIYNFIAKKKGATAVFQMGFQPSGFYAPLQGSFLINYIHVFGPPNLPVTINKITDSPESLTIHGINSDILMINSNKTSNYSVNVFSVDGKQVYSNSIELKEGTNYIPLNTNLPTGLAIVKVSNNENTIVKKTMITD